MIFTPTYLGDSFEIKLAPNEDERGWFARFYCKDEFEKIGHKKEWVQMNHTFTREKGSVRGMHFQHPPFAEIKMVRCIAGAVFDVIVDLRKKSKTFMQWFGTELSAEKQNMIYIPEGFAHGFQTLSRDCELIYLHTEFYTRKYEGGLKFDDPALKINWPLPVADISIRDAAHKLIDKNYEGI